MLLPPPLAVENCCFYLERDLERKCLVRIGTQHGSQTAVRLLVLLQRNLRSFGKIPEIPLLLSHKLNKTRQSVFSFSLGYKVTQK